MPKLETDGKFKARAVAGAPGQSSTGSDRIEVMFEVVDGPEAGKHVWWHGYLTEKTYQRTIEALRACGVRGDDLVELDGLGSKDVEVVVARDEYQGKVNHRVNFINDPSHRGRIAATHLVGRDLEGFRERARALARMADHNAGKPSAAADEDMPDFMQ